MGGSGTFLMGSKQHLRISDTNTATDEALIKGSKPALDLKWDTGNTLWKGRRAARQGGHFSLFTQLWKTCTSIKLFQKCKLILRHWEKLVFFFLFSIYKKNIFLASQLAASSWIWNEAHWCGIQANFQSTRRVIALLCNKRYSFWNALSLCCFVIQNLFLLRTLSSANYSRQLQSHEFSLPPQEGHVSLVSKCIKIVQSPEDILQRNVPLLLLAIRDIICSPKAVHLWTNSTDVNILPGMKYPKQLIWEIPGYLHDKRTTFKGKFKSQNVGSFSCHLTIT